MNMLLNMLTTLKEINVTPTVCKYDNSINLDIANFSGDKILKIIKTS